MNDPHGKINRKISSLSIVLRPIKKAEKKKLLLRFLASGIELELSSHQLKEKKCL